MSPLSTKLRFRSVNWQFSDNENTLPLGAIVVADVGLNYILDEHTELYLQAENLADSRIETDRNLHGLVYLGPPRIVFGGVRLKW